MAFVSGDRVKDLSTSVGTSTFTLAGTPPTNFRSFSSVIGNNYFYYTISHTTLNEWEVGLGSLVGTTLTRVAIYSSSNSNALVNFSVGTKNVFVTIPSKKLIPNQVLIPGGRITLTSQVPIPKSDVTDFGTFYYTPYTNNTIHLYDGYAWRPYAFTETSLMVNFGSPAQLLPRDVFIRYNSTNVFVLETVAWSSDTTRATSLALQDGIYVKNGDPSRRYLGTIRNSGTYLSDTLSYRGIWNMYNRAVRPLFKTDATASWTYNVAAIRAANGLSSNSVSCVNGIGGDVVYLTVAHQYQNSTVGVAARTGIGVNSTSTYAATSVAYTNMQVASRFQTPMGALSHVQPAGNTVYYWLEESTGTGTSTFTSGSVSGLNGFCLC